jgi:MFS family permease
MGTVALLLAALTVTGQISLWMVGALALVQGSFSAIDAPARAALVPILIGDGRLANAVSLHEVWINTARIIGPLLGGVLIATSGVASCFVFNAATFVPVLVAVWTLAPVPPGPADGRSHLSHLIEGIREASRRPELRALLLLAVALGAFFNFGVALPLLATETFGVGAEALGSMIAAVGVGAVFGSLVLAGAGLPSARRLRRLGVLSVGALGLVAVAPSFPMAIAALVVAGAAAVTCVAVANALLLLHSNPTMRGRLLALWSVAIVGSTAVTGPATGAVAAIANPRVAIGTVAASVLVAVLAPTRTFASAYANASAARRDATAA